MEHGVVDRSGAMEPEDLGAAGVDGGQDDREMVLLVADQPPAASLKRAAAARDNRTARGAVDGVPCHRPADCRSTSASWAAATRRELGLEQRRRLFKREAAEAQQTDQRRQGCSLHQHGHQDDREGRRQDEIATGNPR